MGARVKRRKCGFCKKLFPPVRDHQKYCNDKCRIAAFHVRAKEKMRQEIINELVDGLPKVKVAG